MSKSNKAQFPSFLSQERPFIWAFSHFVGKQYIKCPDKNIKTKVFHWLNLPIPACFLDSYENQHASAIEQIENWFLIVWFPGNASLITSNPLINTIWQLTARITDISTLRFVLFLFWTEAMAERNNVNG